MKIDIFNTDKKYNIIYADPPWQYKVWAKPTGLKRSAESHYPTMAKEDIENLPIKNITEKKCCAFFMGYISLLGTRARTYKKMGLYI